VEPKGKLLEEILPMLGAFRVEKNKWPLHAAELQTFAFSVRKPLDLSWFHRLSFTPVSASQLLVDFTALPAEDFVAERGRLEIKFNLEDPQTLPLKVKLTELSSQRVETKSFCVI
jgi:hypothetical protein